MSSLQLGKRKVFRTEGPKILTTKCSSFPETHWWTPLTTAIYGPQETPVGGEPEGALENGEGVGSREKAGKGRQMHQIRMSGEEYISQL